MPWESMLICGLVATLVTILLSKLWKGGAGSKRGTAIIGGLFTVSQTLFSGTLVAYNIANVFAAANSAEELGVKLGFWEYGGLGSVIIWILLSVFIGGCVAAGITVFCGLYKDDKPHWIGSSIVAAVIFTVLFMALGI